MKKKITVISKKEYKIGSLSEKKADKNPLKQFHRWYNAARKKGLTAEAMTLATASKKGRPSARVVLLKKFSEDGFVFFTQYRSPKGRDLLENPYAEMVFFWDGMEREVRISGGVKKISKKESDAYFAARPRDAQIGAWISPQSHVIKSRSALDREFKKYRDYFTHAEIQRPKTWGGYALKPLTYEFWQGRRARLNDRLRYRRSKKGTWKIERLSP